MITIYKINIPIINAITHTAPHHADEVFATVLLSMLFPVHLLRTRDQYIIDRSNATVYDVGGVFDLSKKRFDHHQRDFAEFRPDGTKYSSVGLIWREYGLEIVKKLDETREISDEIISRVVAEVDKTLIKGIDAGDNGQVGDGDYMSVSTAIMSFNSLWDSDEDSDKCFMKACEIARAILEREIKVAISSVYGRDEVRKMIQTADGPVIVMDKLVDGWIDEVANPDNPKAKGLLYAVFPARDGDWNVRAVPLTADEVMTQRKPFPEAWRGLRNRELVNITGVETAVFCHAAGFFAVAKTRADAIKLAEKAVNS